MRQHRTYHSDSLLTHLIRFVSLLILCLCAVAYLQGCSKHDATHLPTQVPEPSPSVSPSPTPVPTASPTPAPKPSPTAKPSPGTQPVSHVSLGDLMGAFDYEVPLVKLGIEHIGRVLASPCFRVAPEHTLTSVPRGTHWEQVVDELRSKHWKLNVEMFTGSWVQNRVYKTVGYENGDGYVHMNRYFVWKAYAVGNNGIHELTHLAGYSHSSASEWTSVPYTSNQKYEECAAQLGIRKDK